ncbi:MAG: magnesium transporter [Bacteroidales bacterium]|nr:magnesium transporter [Bacteroidales bacterium]
MKFELTRAYIDDLKELIEEENVTDALEKISDLHAADIADVFEQLDTEEAHYLFFNLRSELASQILTELEDDNIDRFLKAIPGEIIANVLIQQMNTDDATDIVQRLSPKLKDEVMHHLKDKEHAEDIADLLVFDENTAGGLMAKELIRVNWNWDINTCINDIRRQSEEVENVIYIYVVDDDEKLLGTLPIKKLITNHGKVKVYDILDKEIIYVQTATSSSEVATIMERYDLFALPVVDTLNRLVGRITIDDVVDVIKEQAEKDYQMASGITNDVESNDNIFKQSRARLPWLFIGLLGGVIDASIINNFEVEFSLFAGLALFLPLIAAMAGNVGVQSSFIVIQSIANKTIELESPLKRISKEFLGALFNGFICAVAIFLYNYFFSDSFLLTYTVSVALFSVIIFAALNGTIVPLVLHKFKINPALATGPFITTLNDIMGLFIYLSVARWIYLLVS